MAEFIGFFMVLAAKMEVKENEVYTVEETTELLKISDSTFRRLVKKGLLRAAKIGGQYRVLGREILYLLSPKLENQALKVYRSVKNKLKKSLKEKFNY